MKKRYEKALRSHQITLHVRKADPGDHSGLPRSPLWDDHITPVLTYLHWRPLPLLATYKIILLTLQSSQRLWPFLPERTPHSIQPSASATVSTSASALTTKDCSCQLWGQSFLLLLLLHYGTIYQQTFIALMH